LKEGDSLSKKRNEQPKREMTKRQLTHWQKENRIRRIVKITAVIVIAAVVIAVGVGVYLDKVRPYHQTVVKIDGEEYNMDYYIDMLAYYGLLYGSTSYIPYVTQDAVQGIAYNQFIVSKTDEMGITVSDDEINARIEELGITDPNQCRKDIIHAGLALEKLREYYSDINNPGSVPEYAEQRNVSAMLLESQTQVDAVKARLAKGESFADLAAELSLESVTRSASGELGELPQGVIPTKLGDASNTVLDDAVFASDVTEGSVFSVEDENQYKSVGYWLVEITETQQGDEDLEVYLYVMVLGSEEEALDIKAKLDAGGEGNDFVTLAKEYSQMSGAATDGGEYGYLTKQDIIDNTQLGTLISDMVFAEDGSVILPVNTVSDPVQDNSISTSDGFWLVKVNSITGDDALISDDNRSILLDIAVDDWTAKIWAEKQDTIENLMDTDQLTFAYTEAMER